MRIEGWRKERAREGLYTAICNLPIELGGSQLGSGRIAWWLCSTWVVVKTMVPLVVGSLNIECRIILRNQKGTIILTTTHVLGPSSELLWNKDRECKSLPLSTRRTGVRRADSRCAKGHTGRGCLKFAIAGASWRFQPPKV